MFHRAFFNSIIDKHQHMHFTFNRIYYWMWSACVGVYQLQTKEVDSSCWDWYQQQVSCCIIQNTTLIQGLTLRILGLGRNSACWDVIPFGLIEI